MSMQISLWHHWCIKGCNTQLAATAAELHILQVFLPSEVSPVLTAAGAQARQPPLKAPLLLTFGLPLCSFRVLLVGCLTLLAPCYSVEVVGTYCSCESLCIQACARLCSMALEGVVVLQAGGERAGGVRAGGVQTSDVRVSDVSTSGVSTDGDGCLCHAWYKAQQRHCYRVCERQMRTCCGMQAGLRCWTQPP